MRDQLIFEKRASNFKTKPIDKESKPIPKSEIETYGFGLKLVNRLGRKAIHHDGVTFGFHSQTIRFPEERLTIFILSNNGNLRSDLMANKIANFFIN